MSTAVEARPYLDSYPPSVEKIRLFFSDYINPSQLEFLECKAHEILYQGGYRGGKTVGCVLRGMMVGKFYPGCRGFVARNTYPQLRDTVVRTWLEWAPPEWGEYVKTDGPGGTYYFYNGSEVLFRHFDHFSAEEIKSLNLAWAYVDQAEDVPEYTYDTLLSRLSQTSVPHPHVWITANPKPGWIKRRFIDPPELHSSKARIRVETKENERNLPPNFIENLRREWSEDMQKRFLDADWSILSGLVYPDFGEQHVIEPFPIPPHWRKTLVADYGLNNPTHINAYAVSPDDVHYLIAEYRANGLDVATYAHECMAKWISELPYAFPFSMEHFLAAPDAFHKAFMGSFQMGGWCDPSFKAKTHLDRPTTLEMFTNAGMPMHPANNDFWGARTLITYWLRTDRLKVFNTCPETIQEFQNWMWEENRNPGERNAPEKPQDFNNHSMDCMTYYANLHPTSEELSPPINMAHPAYPEIEYDAAHSQRAKWAEQQRRIHDPRQRRRRG